MKKVGHGGATFLITNGGHIGLGNIIADINGNNNEKKV